jgi:hypothetical protein
MTTPVTLNLTRFVRICVFFGRTENCEQDGRQGQLDSRPKRRGYDDFRSNVSIVMLGVVIAKIVYVPVAKPT